MKVVKISHEICGPTNTNVISQMLEIGDTGDAFQIYNGVYLRLYMARFVRKEDRGPMEVKVGNESRWICMCGLSSNQPFCDGSHKKTADEEAGKTYRYNADGSRSEID